MCVAILKREFIPLYFFIDKVLPIDVSFNRFFIIDNKLELLKKISNVNVFLKLCWCDEQLGSSFSTFVFISIIITS